MITVNKSLYITGNNNIWKTDKYLNIIQQYSGNQCTFFEGIVYSQANQSIYVASFNHEICVFSLDLIYINSISFSSSITIWAITAFNNQLYVGTKSGSILVIENYNIVQTITVCSGNTYIDSFDMDQYGYMAITCYTDNAMYLYFANGTSASKTFPVALPEFSGFDSKGRYVVLSKASIFIYN